MRKFVIPAAIAVLMEGRKGETRMELEDGPGLPEFNGTVDQLGRG